MSNQGDIEIKGTMRMADAYVPSLADGRYTVTVTPDLTGGDGAIPDTPFPQISQDFKVEGARFSVDPKDIHVMYPPAASNGSYADVLPHLVLNRRVLPWERGTSLSNGNSQTPCPWMALLVLTPDEILGDDDNPSVTKTVAMTVADALNSTDCITPDLTLDDPARDGARVCQTVTLPGDVFKAVVPYDTEVAWLAHCRMMMPDDYDPDDHDADEAVPESEYAVVMANRFPLADTSNGGGTKNIIHLVSIEGLEAYLDHTDTTVPSKPIRMFSLASWYCYATPEPDIDFATLMGNFADQCENGELSLRLVPGAPDASAGNPQLAHVQNRLALGYIPATYHVQTGEETFAWYRGPLSPVSTGDWGEQHLYAASAAMMYDTRTQVFDLTYAAAWQLGRSMALADRHFGTSLQNWRKSASAMLALLYDRLNSSGAQYAATVPELGARRLHSKAVAAIDPAALRAIGGHAPQARLRRTGPRLSMSFATQSRALNMQVVLDQDEVQDWILEEGQEHLLPVVDWLRQLLTLQGVPFHYLVPDPNLLPMESMRVFYLDTNWILAAIDGALSIGVQSSRDRALNDTFRDAIIDQLDLPDQVTGFLMRSALVSGWGSLHMDARDGNGGKDDDTIPLLYSTTLSPTVRLCLFGGEVHSFVFSEPPQAMHFGVYPDGTIQMRTADDDNAGKPRYDPFQIYAPNDPDNFTTYLRPSVGTAGGRVLYLSDLIAEISNAGHESIRGSAAFALQLFSTPQFIEFSAH